VINTLDLCSSPLGLSYRTGRMSPAITIIKSSDSLSVRLSLPSQPIRELRTYDLFHGAPTLLPISRTDTSWSIAGHFYIGSALDGIHLPRPPSTTRESSSRNMIFVDLPKTNPFAIASICMSIDEQGLASFDPVVEGFESRSKLATSMDGTECISIL
jgi:hypothetical protein